MGWAVGPDSHQLSMEGATKKAKPGQEAGLEVNICQWMTAEIIRANTASTDAGLEISS